jgi:hypothetical protein
MLVAVGVAAAASTATRKDYAAVALNVLPPGQNGSLIFNKHTNDQAQLHECLTPLFDRVKMADLRRCFKDASLGIKGKPVRVERPRPGVLIERDRWDVPHITGKTAADVTFGAGWATAEDRGLLLELSRAGTCGRADIQAPGRARDQRQGVRSQRTGGGAAGGPGQTVAEGRPEGEEAACWHAGIRLRSECGIRRAGHPDHALHAK